MLESRSKAQKTWDLILIYNENFSKTLWPSGWTLGQATWAKMTPKLLHLWRHSQKILNPQPKIFIFKCDLEDWAIRLSFWTDL